MSWSAVLYVVSASSSCDSYIHTTTSSGILITSFLETKCNMAGLQRTCYRALHAISNDYLSNTSLAYSDLLCYA